MMTNFRVCLLVLLLACLFTMGCGGGGNTTTPASPVSGPYEFVVTSNVTGGKTLVEANLAASGNGSSASGPSQVQILSREKNIWYVNGVCAGSTPGQNGLTADISGSNNIVLTFNQGGNTLTGQGVLTGTTITGNYSVSNSTCPDLAGILGYPAGFDTGGFTGTPTSNLSGTFSGILTLPDGVANAMITLQENSDQTVNVPVDLSGSVDNGTFTFSGSAVGNAIFISGQVNGRVLSWLGYVDFGGQFTGTPNSVLIFDDDTSTVAGLLVKQ